MGHKHIYTNNNNKTNKYNNNNNNVLRHFEQTLLKKEFKLSCSGFSPSQLETLLLTRETHQNISFSPIRLYLLWEVLSMLLSASETKNFIKSLPRILKKDASSQITWDPTTNIHCKSIIFTKTNQDYLNMKFV